MLCRWLLATLRMILYRLRNSVAAKLHIV